MGSYFHPKFLRDEPEQCLQMCSSSGVCATKFSSLMFPGMGGAAAPGNMLPMMPGPFMGFLPGMMPFGGMTMPSPVSSGSGDASSVMMQQQQQQLAMLQMQQFQQFQMQQFQQLQQAMQSSQQTSQQSSQQSSQPQQQSNTSGISNTTAPISNSSSINAPMMNHMNNTTSSSNSGMVVNSNDSNSNQSMMMNMMSTQQQQQQQPDIQQQLQAFQQQQQIPQQEQPGPYFSISPHPSQGNEYQHSAHQQMPPSG